MVISLFVPFLSEKFSFLFLLFDAILYMTYDYLQCINL